MFFFLMSIHEVADNLFVTREEGIANWFLGYWFLIVNVTRLSLACYNQY